MREEPADEKTASAFAESWNRIGSVYTLDQVIDWFAPLEPADFEGREVLELGFGNGSILYHVAGFRPAKLVGIELGDTVDQTRRNLSHVAPEIVELYRGDLTQAPLGTFDLVYCIGVLHHLDKPEDGFRAVLRHTRDGGRFHCWVYAREGNGVVIHLVDPIRRVASRLPWWMTKYGLALPLVLPFFLYAKTISAFFGDRPSALGRLLPLFDYSRWIARRSFPFFHHVAFDQLVTPRTHYIPKAVVEQWLADPLVDPATKYVILRNGNSWKFGGRKRKSEE